MKTCNCTLPYVNPDACKSCPNNTVNDESGSYDWYPNQPYTVPVTQPQTRKVTRTTKTIEKYGPAGEYLGKEIVTKEIEDFERQVYDGTFYIQGSSTSLQITGDSVTDTVYWDPSDPKNLWSYTNCGAINFNEN